MIAIAVFLLSAVALSLYSRLKTAHGLVAGKLSPCPDSPNCVCSEYPAQTGFVEPLVFEADPATAWRLIKTAILASGGRIVREEEGYLSATYTSTVFRFVDDLELRLETAVKRIHVRSASRVGHSDLGVNRQRVADIRQRFSHLSP